VDIEVILTLIIAIYGASLSTYLGYLKYTEGQRQIKVIFEYTYFYEQVTITFVNKGHRPVTITNIMMDIFNFYGDEGHWHHIRPGDILGAWEEVLPFTLEDGDPKTFPLHQMVSGAFTKPNLRLKLFVYDSEGKIHRDYEIRHWDPKQGRYFPQKVRRK